jgi:predicted nucleic acid-binding protein
MRTWLVDTGPLVAYLDSRDPAHGEVADCLDGFTGGLATTSAVITESMHFLSGTPTGPRLLAELVRARGSGCSTSAGHPSSTRQPR